MAFLFENENYLRFLAAFLTAFFATFLVAFFFAAIVWELKSRLLITRHRKLSREVSKKISRKRLRVYNLGCFLVKLTLEQIEKLNNAKRSKQVEAEISKKENGENVSQAIPKERKWNHEDFIWKGGDRSPHSKSKEWPGVMFLLDGV